MLYSLTHGAELLLQDILDHRNENGIIDASYFYDKLNSMNSSEDDLYRSCFKELSDCDYLITHWADDGPYMMSLTSAGLEYFEQKNVAKKNEKKEKRSSLWHDIIIAAIGAVFGGAVTYMLFHFFGIG